MKKILAPLIIVIAVVGAYLLWTFLTQDWRGNELADYENATHGYAFQYPPHWKMMGDEYVLTLYNTDSPPGDGGIPSGIRVDVMALENYDDLSLEDWVDQMEQNGPEEKILMRENVTVAGQPAIRKTANSIFASNAETPPSISVTFIKDDTIFLINYLGREPSYSDEMPGFEALLKSFHFE